MMLHDEALVFCQSLFDEKPSRSEPLGGNSRESVRVYFSGQSIIATKRKNSSRANLEAIVLRELNFGDGPVPKILHYDKEWLIQEDLGDIRLSMVLAKSNEATGLDVLSKCVTGLAEIQRIGNVRKLHRHLPKIGWEIEWLNKFVETPKRLGEFLQLPAPDLDTKKLAEKLMLQTPSFIKWDTRPGNIMVSMSGNPNWIDWEHCGVRNALDDFAWLLGDEYVPDWPGTEETLLTTVIKTLDDKANTSESLSYLLTFGTFHMCQRLSLILSKKGDDTWWDPSECITNDRVGVFQIAAKRTCNKASRWAKKNELTAPLSPWFEKLSNAI
jgi:hypothetical protein